MKDFKLELLNKDASVELETVLVNGCSLPKIYTTIIAELLLLAMLAQTDAAEVIAFEIAIPFCYVWEQDKGKYKNTVNIQKLFSMTAEAGFNAALEKFKVQKPDAKTSFIFRHFTFSHESLFSVFSDQRIKKLFLQNQIPDNHLVLIID